MECFSLNDENVLGRLKKLFGDVEIQVPEGLKNFRDLITKSSQNRFQLLSTLFHKVHPVQSFWCDPDSTPESEDIEDPVLESMMKKFWKVSQWYGLDKDETAIRGTATAIDQYNFWINLLNVVACLTDTDGRHPPLKNTKLLEELLLSNHVGLNIMREADEIIGGSEKACAVLKAITSKVNAEVITLSENTELLRARNAANYSTKTDELNLEYQSLHSAMAKELKGFLNSQDDSSDEPKLNTNSSANNVCQFQSETNEAVNNLENLLHTCGLE